MLDLVSFVICFIARFKYPKLKNQLFYLVFKSYAMLVEFI